MVILQNWAVIIDPHYGYSCLIGICKNHPRKKDGTFVVTSRLVMIDGTNKVAQTASGTKYSLLDPEKDFLSYLKDINKKIEDYNMDFRPKKN